MAPDGSINEHLVEKTRPNEPLQAAMRCRAVEFSRALRSDRRVFSSSRVRSSSFLALTGRIVEFSRLTLPGNGLPEFFRQTDPSNFVEKTRADAIPKGPWTPEGQKYQKLKKNVKEKHKKCKIFVQDSVVN